MPRISTAAATMVAVISIAATALAGCEPAPPPAPHPVTQPTYVALGDSFASMGSADEASSDDFCARSKNNYPELVAQRTGLILKDVSCQGP